MFRKLLVVLAVVLWMCTSAWAQIRHVRGIKSVEAGYGLSKYGSMFHASYVPYFSNKLYGKLTGFYWEQSDKSISLRSIGVDVNMVYSMQVSESFYFNFLGGIGAMSVAPSSIPEGNIQLPSDLKFGVIGGFETEYFLNHKLVLVLFYNSRYLTNADSYGRVRWNANFAIRYNLN